MPINEGLNHYNIVRVSVAGAGDLKLSLFSLPDVNGNMREDELVPIDLDTIGRRSGQTRANFKEEACQLVGKTTEINEWFVIQMITVFVKPVETSYPA